MPRHAQPHSSRPVPNPRAGWPLAALIGAAAASAGLVLGTALKMIRNIKPTPLSYAIGAAGFAAIGLLRWPLVPVVLVIVPTAIVATWWERRR